MAAIINGVPVAMSPPAGYVVDFEHPQRNSVTQAYWLFGVGNFICLLFILQRVYVKLFIQRRVQPEDGCLLVAYVFSIALQIVIIRDFAIGLMGTHAWEMPLSEFLLFLKALYLLPILYNPVQCGAKLTLLLLYRRLSPQRWFQIMVWVVMSIVVSSSVAIMFTTIFPCRPLAGAWDITITDATCVNRVAVYKATAILGAITDLLVLGVPIPIVLPLQMPRKQKAGLIAVLSIGAITVFTSIMRLVALIKSMGNDDQSWGGGPVLLWILVETNLSCICGTLPTLKPFIVHIAPRLLSSHSKFGPSYPGRSTKPAFGTTDKYSRFDDGTMYPLGTVVDLEAERRSREGHGAGASGDDSTSEGWDGRGDTSSDKGIVQTRTVTISYANKE